MVPDLWGHLQFGKSRQMLGPKQAIKEEETSLRRAEAGL